MPLAINLRMPALACLMLLVLFAFDSVRGDVPDPTVTAPPQPSALAPADDSVYQFILHHGTTHYPASVSVLGSLTRWRGGRSQTLKNQ